MQITNLSINSKEKETKLGQIINSFSREIEEIEKASLTPIKWLGYWDSNKFIIKSQVIENSKNIIKWIIIGFNGLIK